MTRSRKPRDGSKDLFIRRIARVREIDIMENKVLPLIFLNLSGEMLYVILQRLNAQNICPEKTSKVIQDILSTMLNDNFIEELFKPQKMYTRLAMRSVFEKLVHSSIMRLNTNSMSKLYDLILMVFKYQVVNCQKHEDILLVTLNHLDAIRIAAQPYPDLLDKVRNVYSLLILNYGNLCYNDYECLYRCIDAFLEDLNIRVSILIKLGLQLTTGEIVKKEIVSQSASENECHSSTCFDFDGERNFFLGKNIYTLSSSPEKSHPSSESQMSSTTVISQTNDKELQGIEEINLLTRLIGNHQYSNSFPEIILGSTSDENFDLNEVVTEESCSFVNINASQKSKDDLENICKDLVLNIEEKPNFDILELLDTVEGNSTS